MTYRSFGLRLFAVLLLSAVQCSAAQLAAGARAVEPAGPAVSPPRGPLADVPWPRLPTSPAWAQLRGTTLVYDGMPWEWVPSEIPGHRSYVLSSQWGVLGVHELHDPVDDTSPAQLLAEIEARQRQSFRSFAEAADESPLTALVWPAGGACGHFRAEKQEGPPSWYSHCVFVRDRYATYLNVVASLEAEPEAMTAIGEVLATVRPRSWRPPTGFVVRAFPDIDGVPVSLRLRLPERFALSRDEYSAAQWFCDRDDAVQFRSGGPVDRDSCVGLRVAPRETYSPDSGRFSTEDRIAAMAEQLRAQPFTSRKGTIHGRPILELTLPRADRIQHLLLILDGDRVLELTYEEPLGLHADGYERVWRELLAGLEG